MSIIIFKNYNFKVIHPIDETLREIGYSTINNVTIIGRNNLYPNVLLYNENENKIFSPYDEKIMSLNKDEFYDSDEINQIMKKYHKKDNTDIITPVFFFIYNFDNYYHYLYDTLPYIYVYLELKKEIKDLKILINPLKYKFNEDILFKIINKDDIIIHNNDNKYKQIFISTSLTHGGYSNNPPRKEINYIYNILKNNIDTSNINQKLINKKYLYISRRTWINNDNTNIGTNYTTRRKMINEDKLVLELEKYGIEEIFTENLNIDEKIYLFMNAKLIIGSIGGGMANLLFSNKDVKSIIIVTPYFLDINLRFKYSLENSNYTYFYDVTTYKEKNSIPLYCRVEIIKTKKIGEIVDYNGNLYQIAISDNDVAGFNLDANFRKDYFKENEFKLLDNGLNSPYIIDIHKLSSVIDLI